MRSRSRLRNESDDEFDVWLNVDQDSDEIADWGKLIPEPVVPRRRRGWDAMHTFERMAERRTYEADVEDVLLDVHRAKRRLRNVRRSREG